MSTEVPFPASAPLAFVAVRRHGLPGGGHDPIAELGAVRVDGATMRVDSVVAALFHPAIARFVYHRDDADGRDVGPIEPSTRAEVAARFLEVVDGAVIVGWNASALRRDLDTVLFEAGTDWGDGPPPILDVPSLAWPALGTPPATLHDLANALGTPQADMDTAIGDAHTMVAAVGRLRQVTTVARRMTAMRGDELAIARRFLDRIEMGREQYGPWSVHSGRDWVKEARDEYIDGGAYLSAHDEQRAQVASAAPPPRPRRRPHRRVVLCVHADPRQLRRAAVAVAQGGEIPVVLTDVLPMLQRSGLTTDIALRTLAVACDEVRVFGGDVPRDLALILVHAESLGRPIRYVPWVARS